MAIVAVGNRALEENEPTLPVDLPRMERVNECDLQVGVVGKLVETELAVRTAPDVLVWFQALDGGTFESSGGPTVTVAADHEGTARAKFRFGPHPGGYAVLCQPDSLPGPQILYRLRALEPAAWKQREQRLHQARVERASPSDRRTGDDR